MEKPASLRAEIERHLPEIAQNPDKLTLFVSAGRMVAHKATLSHETRFTLSLLITDFTGDQDILNTVIIHWLQEHQPDILGPGATDPNAYTFEADILGHGAVDLLIELKLSERTRALIDGHGSIRIDHPPEPTHKRDLLGILGNPNP